MKQKNYHGDILLDLVKENNVKVMVEIGIWRSNLTKFLLRKIHRDIDEYWAVDPWSQQKDQFYKRDFQFWDSAYTKSVKLMSWFPPLKVIRMTSISASKLFPNKYFDLVYIDSNHLYEAVKQDITCWLPKVKKGGILAGHDYVLKERKDTQVREVVDELLGSGNIELIGDLHHKTNVWIYCK